MATVVTHCVCFPEIDYKALMSGSEPLSVLAPALTKSNIHQIAKFAHMIPDKVQQRMCCNVHCDVHKAIMTLLSACWSAEWYRQPDSAVCVLCIC